MKYRITFAAAVAVVSSVLWAQDSITNFPPSDYVGCTITNCHQYRLDVDGTVKQIREQGDMTNLVKKLVESGDVCAVMGHKWEPTPHVSHEYIRDRCYQDHRKCTVCGKVESKDLGTAWK